MYEGLDSLALTDLCLDSFHAGAIAGWPVADTLHAQRHHAALPSRDTVLALIPVRRAISLVPRSCGPSARAPSTAR